MRFLLSALLFFLLLKPSLSQESVPALVWPTSIDSVVLIVEHNLTQEMTFKGQNEIHEEIGRSQLLPNDTKQLLKKLSKSSSYEAGYALLDHSNLFFTLYSGNNRIEIALSTLTRNISITSKEGGSHQAKMSKKLSKQILKFIIRYGYYDELEAIGDLGGLN